MKNSSSLPSARTAILHSSPPAQLMTISIPEPMRCADVFGGGELGARSSRRTGSALVWGFVLVASAVIGRRGSRDLPSAARTWDGVDRGAAGADFVILTAAFL